MQYGFCSHVVLWIHSSLTLLPAPPQGQGDVEGQHPEPQVAHSHAPPSPGPKGDPNTALASPVQKTYWGHGNSSCLCRALLGITACCHANGLAFLDRNSLALEVSKCGCTVVCNPQPKPSQFLHSTQAAYEAYSHTILSSRGTALSGILPVMAV